MQVLPDISDYAPSPTASTSNLRKYYTNQISSSTIRLQLVSYADAVKSPLRTVSRPSTEESARSRDTDVTENVYAPSNTSHFVQATRLCHKEIGYPFGIRKLAEPGHPFGIRYSIPPTDLFELADLPNLCPNFENCLDLVAEGTYIAFIKRKVSIYQWIASLIIPDTRRRDGDEADPTWDISQWHVQAWSQATRYHPTDQTSTGPGPRCEVLIAGTNDLAVGEQCNIYRYLEDYIVARPAGTELLLATLPHRHGLDPDHPVHEETVLVNAFVEELAARHNDRLLKLDGVGRGYFTRHGQHISMRGKRLLAGMNVTALASSVPESSPSSLEGATVAIAPSSGFLSAEVLGERAGTL
ncbi:hypothetical protein J6590_089597 [Homalodisca vitripennis]|nr:hypothetical protein J6590_089597 [Homalodisca vitripennis]